VSNIGTPAGVVRVATSDVSGWWVVVVGTWGIGCWW